MCKFVHNNSWIERHLASPLFIFNVSDKRPISAVTTEKHSCLDIWPPLLISSVAVLRQLAGSTEQDFLRIGSQMQEAYAHTVDLSQTARSLVDVVSGDRVGMLMEQLHKMLADMAAYLNQSQRLSTGNCTLIGQVESTLKKVKKPVEDFRQMAKQLYIFEVLIRIESTYLKEMGTEFVNLASDIHQLSLQIKSKTAFIRGNLDSLSKTVGHNSRFFEQHIALGEERKKFALANTEDSLVAMENMHQKYLQSGSAIESVACANSEDISEIVQSMQMHDSFRQQVEHVFEAIEGILPYCTGSEAPDQEQREQDFREAVSKIGDVCEIQHAQLNFASTILCDSVATIIAKLHSLRESQNQIAGNITSGLKCTNRGGSSLGDITANIASVTDLLREYGTTSSAMDSMVRNVLQTMGDITEFVGDVEQFSSQIIQIALNARIKAVSTGQDGAAMSVLSEEVGQLSKEAIQRTESISQALGQIRTITASIAGESEQEQHALTDQLAAMQQQLDQLLAELDQTGDELRSMSELLLQKNERLGQRLEQLIGGIDVHRRIKNMTNEVLAKLEQVYTAARAECPATAAFKEELHNLAARYTMESERRIHAEIARKHGIRIQEPAQQATAEGAAEASEFGDNIDLF